MKQLELTNENVFSYDTRRFKFAELVRTMLLDGCEESEMPLAQLHTLAQGKTSHLLTFANDQNLYFHHKYYNSPRLPLLLSIYQDFIKRVIAPQFVDNQLVVQAKPTFRIHLPNNTAVPSDTGNDLSRPGLHCDADYNHPDNELNFWVPLTPCVPGNTLHVESAPGKGDFRPMLLENGKILRFWGARCLHFNQMNHWGPTRVSFDFRIMNKSDWDAMELTQRSPGTTVQRKLKLTLGDYYMLYDKSRQQFSHHETVAGGDPSELNLPSLYAPIGRSCHNLRRLVRALKQQPV